MDPYNNPFYNHNAFPNYNQNDNQNHNHNYHVDHNAFPNQHQFLDHNQFLGHNQFQDHSQVGEHDPFADPNLYAHQYSHADQNNYYHNNAAGSSSGGHVHSDDTHYSSSAAYQGGHSSSVQSTYHVTPPTIQQTGSTKPLEVKIHNSIIFHQDDYPDIIRPYVNNDMILGLKYAEMHFPPGYYRISDDGTKFITVPHKEGVMALVSVPDMYVLGVLELSASMHQDPFFTFYGLYAPYGAKMLRVSRPPSDDGAEMMLKKEIAILDDKRIFLIAPLSPPRRRN